MRPAQRANGADRRAAGQARGGGRRQVRCLGALDPRQGLHLRRGAAPHTRDQARPAQQRAQRGRTPGPRSGGQGGVRPGLRDPRHAAARRPLQAQGDRADQGGCLGRRLDSQDHPEQPGHPARQLRPPPGHRCGGPWPRGDDAPAARLEAGPPRPRARGLGGPRRHRRGNAGRRVTRRAHCRQGEPAARGLGRSAVRHAWAWRAEGPLAPPRRGQGGGAR
mmetsp:Transcript_16559/g.62641  ORF Transcript_16559/g.62641 Transcript_16559/m.62641 type:complete len:220 (-) Transcript_16559:2238-2897(-)